jgi:hypothetical protein
MHYAVITYIIDGTTLTEKLEGPWISSQITAMGTGGVTMYNHEGGEIVRTVQYHQVQRIEITRAGA